MYTIIIATKKVSPTCHGLKIPLLFGYPLALVTSGTAAKSAPRHHATALGPIKIVGFLQDLMYVKTINDEIHLPIYETVIALNMYLCVMIIQPYCSCKKVEKIINSM